MKKQFTLPVLTFTLLFLSASFLKSQDSLIISEFMAINDETLMDEDSSYADWIEIYNSSSSAISLDGWCLTDEAGNFSKWPFPNSLTLDPKEYLIVFASGKNRTVAKDSLHTNFKLSGSGEFLALSNPDSSFYTSVFSPAYPKQFIDVSYSYFNGKYIYSSSPTPGGENDSIAFVAPPKFSKQHGFYDESFKIAISSDLPEAEIYYTTDASTPGFSNGTLYSDSIEITETTIIRAIVVLGDTASSTSVSMSYLFLNDVFNQFEDQPGYPDTWLSPMDYMEYFEIESHYHMNEDVLNMNAVRENLIPSIKSLPTISIVTDIDHLFSKSTHADSGGIYMYSGEPLGSTRSLEYHLGRGWERPASVEYFNSSEDDGDIDFQENCGLKIHGGASRSTRKTLKRSLKIGFKSEYGPTKLKVKMFGKGSPSQYDRLILRGGFDRRLENQVVDPWVKHSMRDMGHYAARSKFVHLFLNGMYWGMYNLSEQLDVNCVRDNLGGSASDYDIIKDYYEVEAGDTVAWDEMIALAAEVGSKPENYQYLLGNKPDGTPDPSIEKLLNVENFIDYIILIAYNNNWDWDHHNWAAARRRTNSEGFHFLVWDAESGLSNGSNISMIMGGGNENRPSGLFSDLMSHQDFRDRVITRVNRSFFEDGALTPHRGYERYLEWLDELDTALIADQARWYADVSDIWNITHHNWRDDYFDGHTESVFKSFVSNGVYPTIPPPVFNTTESTIPYNFPLTMTGPESGNIRYTIDGPDPGYFNPPESNAIQVYNNQTITLPAVGEKITISARSKVDTLWSTLVKKTFTISDVVSTPDASSIAGNVSISNYPNPATNYTHIRYILPEQSEIGVKVYSMIGEYIATLEHGEMFAGEHTITWNMDGISAGIYFCILEDYSSGNVYRVKIVKN